MIDRSFSLGRTSQRNKTYQSGSGRYCWRDGDGFVHDMREMTSQHLRHCLEICHKKGNTGKAKDIREVLLGRQRAVRSALARRAK